MAEFDKKQYAINRQRKIRGQGEEPKPKVVVNDTSTILFIDGKPTKTNRAQRRRMLKNATKD